MSTQSDLLAYYNAQAALITDEGDRLEALDDITRWNLCRTAIAALSGNQVTSYSIGGRSVTKQQLPSLRDQEAILLTKVKAWIGRGGIALVDQRYGDDSGGGTLI
jgi:hypothetical protein